MLPNPPSPPAIFGMTLAEYAASRGTHAQSLREEYLRCLRYGAGLTLPPITRHDEQDGVSKFCLAVGGDDGKVLETESVIIPMRSYRCTDWHTLCLSSQVGCRMACTFCETARMGWLRNLSAAEIVAQRLVAREVMQARTNLPLAPSLVRRGKTGGAPLLTKEGPGEVALALAHHRPYRYFGDGIQNIVFMGMGEPLANYENLLKALKILNAPWGGGIGARKITLSTVGLVPQIKKLADEPMQLRLAVSLHGATDDVREKIMPVNKKYPLKELLDACDYYVNTKKRMMTFEYILIEGVNDSLEQAHKLGAAARRLRAKVNLIPCNPVDGLLWKRPDRDRCKMFQHTLQTHGITSTLRLEKGTDINAACGQLRLQHETGAKAAPKDEHHG